MVGQGEGEYVTADEACNILGVTRKTLDRYAKAGRIRKYRRGIRNVVFKRADVERLKRELEDIRPVDNEEQ
jgi:excisionase family DNA binding protein